MRIKCLAMLGPAVLLASAAFTGTASAASTGPEALVCNSNWSVSSSQGRAAGKWCYNNGAGNAIAVRGTVTDTNADGRCPFVQVTTSAGWKLDSDWAGPRGDSSPVTIDAPSGQHLTGLAIKYITC